MEHILDNPVWNALLTGNRIFSNGDESVQYFPNDVAPFVSVRDNSIENLELLHTLYPYDTGAALVSMKAIDIPKCWNVIQRYDILQMVCDKQLPKSESPLNLVPLTEKDIPQMLSITALTNPGPFLQRTIQFGHYKGIFSGDRLVAMAGQRMHPLPYAEVSAVCTHPDHSGKGFARMLVVDQVQRIQAAKFIPFLHVKAENTLAIKLYESIGFKTRKPVFIYFMEKEK